MTTKTLSDEFVNKDARLVELKAILKAAEEEKRRLEAEFKAAIGQDTVGVLPNGVEYTNKIVTRASYTVAETVFERLDRKAAVLKNT
jgi:hypothetical protein